MDLKNSTSHSALSEGPTVRKFISLRFKLGFGLFLMFLILVGSNLWLIWVKGLPLLIQQSKDLNTQIGENIVAELNQQFKQAEALTKDLANLSESLPKESNIIHRVVPHLLDMESMRNVIAGGGIWPEPFQFDPARERSSFFWGRNTDTQLKFYNNYNDPDGPGYHSEEWYVPATMLPDGEAYWSKSYTDPYSLQPMVTCSVPIYEPHSTKISGVATVDLKLEGVNNLVTEKLRNRPGYAFVIDRNNKFIAFPDQSMVITQRQGQNNQAYSDFIYVNELAQLHPVFTPIADKLTYINHRDTSIVNRDADKVKHLAKKIADASYQIDIQEARVIAHNLFKNTNDSASLLASFQVADDILLHNKVEVTVYQMPHTYWKIVTVFPFEDSIETALSISQSVTWGSLTSIILWGILCTFFLWRVLFSRLHEMTQRIKESAKDGKEIPLEHSADDELGVLAQWYNRRTQQLHQALKSAEISGQSLKRENNEHKVTAKLLAKSLSMQRAMVDSANLAIITLDQQGRVMNCNTGTTKILGYQEQDLLGKVFPHVLIDGRQVQQYRDALQQQYDILIDGFKLFTIALDQGERQENEWNITCKNGNILPAMLTITAVISSHHAIEGWLAVIADITERKQAQAELEQARIVAENSNLAKTQFLTSMSHELRTPLNSILGFSRRLQKSHLTMSDKQNQDAISIILRNANHLMILMNELLDISNIEVGKLELNRDLFNLGRLIEEVYSDTRTLNADRNIEYSYNLPKEDIYIEGDRAKIKQIVYNLVANAFGATEQGSVDISVSLHKQTKTVSIHVTDTGKGIPPENRNVIFARFSNLSNEQSNQIAAGLSLFITKQLVQMHHGKISFESTVGRGSKFSVELPLNGNDHR